MERLDAKHIKHNWRDSFSEARNVGLAAAEQAVVLILDGNERIEPKVFDLIDALVEAGIDDGVIHCLRIDVVDSRGEVIESTYEPRLWKASDEIRYEGRIYERLECGSNARFVYHDEIRSSSWMRSMIRLSGQRSSNQTSISSRPRSTSISMTCIPILHRAADDVAGRL